MIPAINQVQHSWSYHEIRGLLLTWFESSSSSDAPPLRELEAQMMMRGIPSEIIESTVTRAVSFLAMKERSVRSEPFAADRFIQSYLHEASPRCARYFAADRPDLCLIHGDREMLEHFFHLLLDNALRHTRHRERQLIFLRRAIEMGPDIFVLGDNGEGFMQEHAARIFTLCQGIPDAFAGGAGIGLTHAKLIARKHGGRIWAEGRPDDGTRIYFQLTPEN